MENIDKLDKVRTHLEKKNAQFKELDKAEQRVQIAKDVIKQLKTGKLIPRSRYFAYHLGKDQETADCLSKKDEKTNLAELTSQTKCEVCGIGSLFVAAIERDAAYKIGGKRGKEPFPDREDEVEHLEKYFSRDELDLIEDHFEQNDFDGGEKRDQQILDEPDRGARLEMIMQNIIKNKGHFKVRKPKKDE